MARDRQSPAETLIVAEKVYRMDGARLAAEVQRMLPDTRVLLMAAYPSDETLDWPVLVKPFKPDELETAVHVALEDE